MLYRYRKIILTLIIILGFALRFYGATTVPANHDEYLSDLPTARQINFDLKNPNFPLLDNNPDFCCGSMIFRYVIKLGWCIFGNGLLGARLPFTIVGTLTIVLIYLLTKSTLGTLSALIAALLLSISQYHVGLSRLADNNSLFIFFVIFSLFIFYKSIESPNKKLLLANGLIIGIGCWVKENTVFLIPIYTIFLLVCPKFRFWLKDKYFWWSNIVTLFAALPLVCLNLAADSLRLHYILENAALGISLNAAGFYLGELILLILRFFPQSFFVIFSNLESEYPSVNFILGTLMLAAAIRSIRNKTPFMRLLLVCFLFNFVVFSFIRPVNPAVKTYWSLECLDWSILGFVPGIILAADMLRIFVERHKLSGQILFGALVIFMLIRTWDLVTYPLHCFFPTRDLCIRKLLDDYGYSWFEDCGLEKTKDAAKDIYERIYKITDNRPPYKRLAALKLAQILQQEGRYKESKKYLNYVLSQDSTDNIALELLERLD